MMGWCVRMPQVVCTMRDQGGVWSDADPAGESGPSAPVGGMPGGASGALVVGRESLASCTSMDASRRSISAS